MYQKASHWGALPTKLSKFYRPYEVVENRDLLMLFAIDLLRNTNLNLLNESGNDLIRQLGDLRELLDQPDKVFSTIRFLPLGRNDLVQLFQPGAPSAKSPRR